MRLCGTLGSIPETDRCPVKLASPVLVTTYLGLVVCVLNGDRVFILVIIPRTMWYNIVLKLHCVS